MRQLVAIALNGFREASRNRITVVIFAFALVLILSATVALEFTVTTFERVMTDLGLGVMSLIAFGLTTFLGSGLIPREIERRTIFMVVSRPVSRSTFVVGRLLGNVLTVVIVTTIMFALLVGQLTMQHVEVTRAVVAAFAGMLMEVVLLSSLAIFFSTWSTQMTTVVSTVGLYLLGNSANELYRLSTNAKSGLTQVAGRALYYVLPNFSRLDFKGQATYNEFVSATEVLSSAGYTLAYAVVLTVAACAVFERRDFK